MDPITLATVALTLLATKATEKIGEQLGEGAIASAQQLMALLQRKSPDTVKRLAAADDPNVIDVEVVEEELRQVMAADPEVRAAVNATAAAARADEMALQHLTKLAEKIGVVNLGTVQNQTNNINI
ncbi:MAG: hypothetical protein HC771_18300 [Synechococcales cyanobacterium CRU_2_2]|nr:hypothetical protein [Synechococcales cyanobacterium CRU_2_2]